MSGMERWRWRVGVSLILLSACGASDKDDVDGAGGGPGLDPSGDLDADYLSNGDERALGTDPENPDSDGDGYLDGDEVLEGSNPLDPESRIYQGGWPYQRLKGEIVDPGFDSTPVVGAVIPHLTATDQFGERVDLYDFAMHGRPVVIDLSALWCNACVDLAHWLAHEPSYLDAKPELSPIVDMVEKGEVYWVTVVFQDGAGNDALPTDGADWAERFPDDKVAVLVCDDPSLFEYLYPGSYPSIQVLDEDMTFRAYDRFDAEAALRSLLP